MLRQVMKAEPQENNTYTLTLECGHIKNNMRGFSLWLRCWQCEETQRQIKPIIKEIAAIEIKPEKGNEV